MLYGLNAGLGRSAITPPVGISLTGYATRPGNAAAIHDDLFCKTAIFSNGKTEAAVACLDILSLDFEQVARIKNEVDRLFGIPEENVFIFCSHTHAGPATQILRFCGVRNEEYLSWMLGKVIETIGKAKQDMAPCRVETSEATADLAINRRYKAPSGEVQLSDNADGICDRQVKLIRILRDGKPGAVIYNYSCHGVVLGADNVQVSADWIGAASSFIEGSTGDMAMFIQGCCGDINPRIRGGFDQVKAAGEIVGKAVVDALSKEGTKWSGSTIVASSVDIDLPFQPLPPRDELVNFSAEMQKQIDSERAKGTPENMLDWPKGLEEWSRVAIATLDSGSQQKSLPIKLGVLRINGIRILAIPGEVFTGFALAVKSADPDVIVAGYANGNIGYVPTAKAYEEGGYEVDAAYKLYGIQMIGPESEGIIVGAAREMLR